MTYREPGSIPEETDPEQEALAALRGRAASVRRVVHVTVILSGLAAGVFLYVALRDWQLSASARHFPYVTGVLSFVPTFGLSLKVAPLVADRIVRRLLPRWRRRIATERGLDPAELEEMTRLLE